MHRLTKCTLIVDKQSLKCEVADTPICQNLLKDGKYELQCTQKPSWRSYRPALPGLTNSVKLALLVHLI